MDMEYGIWKWNMDSKGIPNLKPYADLNYISRILISEYLMSTANISSERSGGLRQMEIKQVLFWLSITSITFRLIYFN
jgi:hypothetical protein